jgi:hypothetical protein
VPEEVEREDRSFWRAAMKEYEDRAFAAEIPKE